MQQSSTLWERLKSNELYQSWNRNMNNKDFITRLAKKSGLSAADVAANVDALVGIMTECLKENDQLNISGFGTLEVKMRNERLSVNPKTGQRFLVPPKIVPAFKPSNKLKDKFK